MKYRNAATGWGLWTVALVMAWLALPGVTARAEKFVVDLPSRDIVYSPLDNRIYATVPNASATNPNTLTPIDPSNGTLGAPVAIGFDPWEAVISDDGTRIHTVIGGRIAVQGYDVDTQTLGSFYALPGGPQVNQMHAVPGRPDAVVLTTHMPGFSPPATGTIVVENGVRLPDQVGSGTGTGGPDIVAVDPTDGTRAYGYENSNTNFTNWSMNIDATGIHQDLGPTLQGILTGHDVDNIALLGNRLFTNRGEVFSLSPAIQVGAFLGGENFTFDLDNDLLFSLTSSGTTHTLRAYSLSTLGLVGEDTVTDVTGTTSSLTRYGQNGFAFVTSNDQVVLFTSNLLVPEPTSSMLALMALLGFNVYCRRRRRERCP